METVSIISAIIATIISSITAIVSYLINKKNTEILYIKHVREYSSKFSEKIFDLRISHYGAVNDIICKIDQFKAPQYINHPDELKDIASKLYLWNQGIVPFILSPRTISCWRDLCNSLCKNPGSGEFLSETQAKNILKSKTEFRKSLRADIWSILIGGDINYDPKFERQLLSKSDL